MERARENLRLLAIFHFVYAGVVFLGSLVPTVWLLMASLWWPELASEAGRDGDAGAVAASSALGAALVGTGILLAWVWAAVLVFAGQSLLTARRHTFCMVVAAIACLNLPLGTVLGVVSLILLNREETRRLFGAGGTEGPDRPRGPGDQDGPAAPA
jgi:hypothetical protein